MCDPERLIEEVRRFPVLYDQMDDKYWNVEYKEKVWQLVCKSMGSKDLTVEECKRKWSCVRDQFRRTLHKRKTATGQTRRKYKYGDNLSFLLRYFVEKDNKNSAEGEEEDVSDSVSDTQTEFLHESIRLHNSSSNEVDSINTFDNPRRVLGKKGSSFNSSNPYDVDNKQRFIQSRTRKQRRLQNKIQNNSSNYQIACQLAENVEGIKQIRDRSNHPVEAFLSCLAPTLKTFNPLLLNEAKSKIFAIVQECEMKQLVSDQAINSASNVDPLSTSSHITDVQHHGFSTSDNTWIYKTEDSS